MVSITDYAALSTRAYAATARNRTPVPNGWQEVEWIADRSYGFSAGVYKSGNEIVIAFTGINEGNTMDWVWDVVGRNRRALAKF